MSYGDGDGCEAIHGNCECAVWEYHEEIIELKAENKRLADKLGAADTLLADCEELFRLDARDGAQQTRNDIITWREIREYWGTHALVSLLDRLTSENKHFKAEVARLKCAMTDQEALTRAAAWDEVIKVVRWHRGHLGDKNAIIEAIDEAFRGEK